MFHVQCFCHAACSIVGICRDCLVVPRRGPSTFTTLPYPAVRCLWVGAGIGSLCDIKRTHCWAQKQTFSCGLQAYEGVTQGGMPVAVRAVRIAPRRAAARQALASALAAVTSDMVDCMHDGS